MDLVQSCFIAPTIDALKTSGAPVPKLLRQAGVDRFALEYPNAVMPVPVMLNLFTQIAHAEGSTDFPGEIATQYRLEKVPGWGDALLTCPDILRTIQLATSPLAKVMSNNLVSARLDGPRAVFETSYTAKPSLAQEWVAIVSFLLTLDGFRAGCGANWVPDEIDIAASNIDVLDRLVDLSGVRVRTSQKSTRFYFKSRELLNDMTAYHSERPADAPLPDTAQSKLLRLFDSLKPMQKPTLEFTAEWFDSSPRSLQRVLAAEAATFASTLQNWRIKKAIELLEFGDASISEVSEQLHYAHTPHFVRAFRSWFGTSPAKYRERLAGL